MTKDALKLISDAMNELNLNYEFAEWTSDAVYPYFIGEYNEFEAMNEDGQHEANFLITGFSRSSWLELENAKAAISNYFNKVSGKTVIADTHNAIAVFYLNSLIVPTGDAELKRIQINLKVKEWSVN